LAKAVERDALLSPTNTGVTKIMANIFSLNTMKPINASTPSANAVEHVYGVEASDFNELDKIMKNIDIWGIDLFKVDELTFHRPLTAVTYTIFKVSILKF